MAAIFPPAGKGGVAPGPNVVNGYTPTNTVIGDGPLYIAPDCTTVLTDGQMNAVTSEILAAVDRVGESYNTDRITNLGDAIVAGLAQTLDQAVRKTGDQMTGPLILSGNPTEGLGAATKYYADTKVSKAGDMMTGPLLLDADPATPTAAANRRYVDAVAASIIDSHQTANVRLQNDVDTRVRRAGDQMTGALMLARNPSEPMEAATKTYVDAHGGGGGGGIPEAPNDSLMYGRQSQNWARAVAVAGDTMTGDLTIGGLFPHVLVNKTNALSGVASVAGATLDRRRWDVVLADAAPEASGNTGSDFAITRYNDAGEPIDDPVKIDRATGHLTVGDGGVAFGSGALTSAGDLTITKNMPTITLNRTDINEAGTGFRFDLNGVHRWAILSGQADASTFAIQRYDNAGNFIDNPIVIDRSNGQVVMPAPGGLAVSHGPIVSNGTDGLRIEVSSGSYARVVMTVVGVSSWSAGCWSDGNYRITNESNALQALTLTWSGNHYLAGNWFVSAQGYKPGGGVWADSSDSRIKTVTADYRHGLDEVLQLQPVYYTFKGNDTREPPQAEPAPTVPYPNSPHHQAAKDGKRYVGLVAQQVEGVMPDMVTRTDGYIDGLPVNDLRNLDAGPLIFALVNAVKTLAARVETLEAKGVVA